MNTNNVMAKLAENEIDSIEDGGSTVTQTAKESLSKLIRYLNGIFNLTAFARRCGGVYLIADYGNNGKQLSFRIAPDHQPTTVAATAKDMGIVMSEIIDECDMISMLNWLKSP